MNKPPIPPHLMMRKQPKQLRTRKLIETIFASTSALVIERGFAAVNTNAIAKHANVDITSLYQFFPNKEAILYAIADRWLEHVRAVCRRFQEEAYQTLDWRAFFLRLNHEVNTIPEHGTHYASLSTLWETLPEFAELERYHQQWIVAFLCGELRRFGATAPAQTLQERVLYLYLSTDGIAEVMGTYPEPTASALRQLQYQTWEYHLAPLLDKQ